MQGSVAGLVGAGETSQGRLLHWNDGLELARQRKGSWGSKCREESDKATEKEVT